jgi:hypothetical protein
VALERGPLSLVRINEELFERKVAAPVQKTEINDRGESVALTTRHPSIRKVGTKFRRQVAVAQSVDIVRLRAKDHGVCLSGSSEQYMRPQCTQIFASYRVHSSCK